MMRRRSGSEFAANCHKYNFEDWIETLHPSALDSDTMISKLNLLCSNISSTLSVSDVGGRKDLGVESSKYENATKERLGPVCNPSLCIFY
jgi:hypothetical protein